MAAGFGHLLGNIGLGKRLERDNHLGVRFAQNGRDLFRFQKRVDGIGDPGNRTAQKGDDGFGAVGQHIGDHVGFADAQLAEQVRCLNSARPQFGPCQRFCLVLRP